MTWTYYSLTLYLLNNIWVVSSEGYNEWNCYRMCVQVFKSLGAWNLETTFWADPFFKWPLSIGLTVYKSAMEVTYFDLLGTGLATESLGFEGLSPYALQPALGLTWRSLSSMGRKENHMSPLLSGASNYPILLCFLAFSKHNVQRKGLGSCYSADSWALPQKFWRSQSKGSSATCIYNRQTSYDSSSPSPLLDHTSV